MGAFTFDFHRNLRPFDTVLVEPCVAYGPFERQRKPICLECLEPPLSVILKSERPGGHEADLADVDHEELCELCKFPICHDSRCRQSHAESGECSRLQALSSSCEEEQSSIYGTLCQLRLLALQDSDPEL